MQAGPRRAIFTSVSTVIAMRRHEAPSPTAQHLHLLPALPDPALVRRFAQLSDRELDVVRLIASGMSNAEIAGHLYLSEGTVKTYVTRTLNKLRLRSRVQIVVAAFDAGVVKPNEGPRV